MKTFLLSLATLVILMVCTSFQAQAFNQLKKNVTTATTAEPLSATTLMVSEVTIQIQDQAGRVYIGDSNVSAATHGHMLEAPAADATPDSITLKGPIDLNKVYIDVETSTQGVQCVYP